MNRMSWLNMRRAKLAIWPAVWAPVKWALPESSRLPQKRPMVPAWVLSRPAFHRPLHIRSSMTCTGPHYVSILLSFSGGLPQVYDHQRAYSRPQHT